MIEPARRSPFIVIDWQAAYEAFFTQQIPYALFPGVYQSNLDESKTYQIRILGGCYYFAHGDLATDSGGPLTGYGFSHYDGLTQFDLVIDGEVGDSTLLGMNRLYTTSTESNAANVGFTAFIVTTGYDGGVQFGVEFLWASIVNTPTIEIAPWAVELIY